MTAADFHTQFSVNPDRGTYLPGEPVQLLVTCGDLKGDSITVEIFNGLDLVSSQTQGIGQDDEQVNYNFHSLEKCPVGYGVKATLFAGERILASCQTAFDVLPDWTAFPRYGFLCDFTPSRRNANETVDALNCYHLNGLQFYDWQYRHDSLVPPQEQFLDPLGRPLSLKTTKALIAAAHSHGIKAMPYLAIYAASAAFWKAHTDWALYDEKGGLIPFGEDFLGIMDPTAGKGWSEHLLAECANVLKKLHFDGLHIDQYGDPKVGFNNAGGAVNLPKAFADFIRTAVAQHPGQPVLFNAVGNWPIETLAQAPVAFNYIEIWPPSTSYDDVAAIVRNARKLSGGKPVVIALYIPAVREINNRLADAMIFSAGGSRIEVGENGRLLSDPYFPRHEAMSDELSTTLRCQTELLMRYEEWISPLVEESPLPSMDVPDGIRVFFRHGHCGYSLSLVNLTGTNTLNWNDEHPVPMVRQNFNLEIEIAEPVKRVHWVSPDDGDFSPLPLDFIRKNNRICVQVPILKVWGVLLFEK